MQDITALHRAQEVGIVLSSESVRQWDHSPEQVGVMAASMSGVESWCCLLKRTLPAWMVPILTTKTLSRIQTSGWSA